MAKPPRNPASGILFVDKPQGITSHGVVSRARKSVGTRKIGHAGTLDPMATGLLVLGANNATRLLTYLVGLDKQYTATIRLGASSNTDDAEGELSEPADAAALAAISDDDIARAVSNLTGVISQRPSSVSAIKVDGKRAYALARAGEEVVLAERTVTVSVFEVLEIARDEYIDLRVRVDCSSGTYIRALARDLGEALSVGGHLTVLRRTRVGPFSVDDASALDSDLETQLVAPATVARELFETVALDAQQSEDLANGKRIALEPRASSPVAALSPDGRLQGLIEIVDGRARVLSNFPRDPRPVDPQEQAASQGEPVSEEGTPNIG